MALTGLEVKQLVENFVYTNPGFDWGEWNDETFKYGLHHKFDYQLPLLQQMFEAKMQRLYNQYQALRDGTVEMVGASWVDATSEDVILSIKDIKAKAVQAAKNWRATNAEIAGRQAGVFGPGLTFDRYYVGTNYYVDFVDGSDASPHTGLKYGNYTADSGTDTTTLVDTEPPRTTDDDWNGAWIWNVTRGAGAKITDSVYSSGWTFTHGSIAGQTSGDTYYIIDAWATFEKFAESTLSPGDTAYVRANKTQTYARSQNINFTSDGSQSSPIQIIGCDSVTNDPWGDGSDVKPILDFNSLGYGLYPIADDNWHMENIQIQNNTWTYIQRFDSCKGWSLKDVYYTDGTNGVYSASPGYFIRFEDCKFDELVNTCAWPRTCVMYFKNCDFDGHSTPGDGDFGVRLQDGGAAILDGCTLGQTTAFSSQADCLSISNGGGFIYARNTIIGSYPYAANFASPLAMVFLEDHNGTKGDNRRYGWSGAVTSDTTVVRSGGGNTSAKLQNWATQSRPGVREPLTLSGFYPEYNHESPFKIWCPASSTTITVYMRAISAWTGYPTASELYLEASYLSSGSGGARTTVASNDVLSDATTWVAFDVTFTPSQAGWVYLDVVLKKYEASNGVYIDVKPVVS